MWNTIRLSLSVSGILFFLVILSPALWGSGDLRSDVMSGVVTPSLSSGQAELTVLDVTEEQRGTALSRGAGDQYFLSMAGWDDGTENGYAVEPTADGGFIATGQTNSIGSGFNDVLLVKYDSSGALEWARVAGGASTDAANDVIESADGGYLVAGITASFGAGGLDVLLLKFDGSGTLQWSRTAGGTGHEYGLSMDRTLDDCFIITGHTDSFGAGDDDVLLLKYDDAGTLLWARTYGGADEDKGNAVCTVNDGGYIIAGETNGFGVVQSDVLVLKLDSAGTLDWAYTAGGSPWSERAFGICQTTENLVVITGYANSFGAGSLDLFTMAFDIEGNLGPMQTVGGPGSERGYSVHPTVDGGHIVAGYTENYGAGEDDWLVLKFDKVDSFEWARTVGGDGFDFLHDISSLDDGGYLMAGHSTSFGALGWDLLVARTDARGMIHDCPHIAPCYPEVNFYLPTILSPTVTVGTPSLTTGSPMVTVVAQLPNETEVCSFTYPYPEYGMLATGGTLTDTSVSIRDTPDGGLLVAGATESYGAGGFDILLLKYDSSGVLQWARTAGGDANEWAWAMELTSDGGCIVSGYTYSYGVGNGYRDALIVRFDHAGNLLWARTAGGTYWEDAYDVCVTSDGGFIVTGETGSVGPGPYHDVMLLKYDIDGSLEWARVVGGDNNDEGNSVCQTPDGWYAVTGFSQSFNDTNDFDLIILMFDSSGSLRWTRVVGSEYWDWGNSVQSTGYFEIVIAGYSSGYGEGGSAMLLNFSLSGNMQWARAVGGASFEEAHAMDMTSDGGFVVTGRTSSFGPGTPDAINLFLWKFGYGGTLEWARAAGGDGEENGLSVKETADGGFAASGFTLNSFGAGQYDAFLLRTDESGLIDNCPYMVVSSPDVETIDPAVQEPSLSEQIPTFTYTSPNLYTGSAFPDNEAVCPVDTTVAAEMTCTPPVGVLPLQVHFEADLTNLYTGFVRVISARIDVTLANGQFYPNWRSGYTNLAAGGSYTASFNQTLPYLATLLGTNTFQLVAEDTTPAPYNQPPYPPSGDTDTSTCEVVGMAP